MSSTLPVALSIGGSDSCCGAGIQADLKAFEGMGVYGATAITAVTAQNTRKVSEVFPVPARMLSAQIGSVLSDLRPGAIKTGMLCNSELITAVSESVAGCRNVVVDPVMVSETGRRLLEKEAVRTLCKELLPLACIATPNVHEAEVLSGVRIRSLSDAKKAAKKIPASSVIIKGGHLSSKTDVLFRDKKMTLLPPSFIFRGRMHGRGCCFSAAVAAGLAKGLGIPRAVADAKSFVDRAIIGRASPGRGLPVANACSQQEMLGTSGAVSGRAARLRQSIERAVFELSRTDFAVLLPEVGSNLVALLPGARSTGDVAGIDGRIRRGKAGIIFGRAYLGVSTHMASALLSAHRLDASVNAALNVLHTPHIFSACKRAGLSLAVADRSDEPGSVRERDGASMPWAVRQAYATRKGIPDVIYHTGAFGKEPLLLFFGSSPDGVVSKVKAVLEAL